MRTIDWKNRTPAEKITWDYVRALIAWNTLTPLHSQNEISLLASEFEVYAATKLYFALELDISSSNNPAEMLTSGTIVLFDELDVPNYSCSNNGMVWNVTAAEIRYCSNHIQLHNVFFSRLAALGYDYMKFNGYRLDII